MSRGWAQAARPPGKEMQSLKETKPKALTHLSWVLAGDRRSAAELVPVAAVVQEVWELLAEISRPHLLPGWGTKRIVLLSSTSFQFPSSFSFFIFTFFHLLTFFQLRSVRKHAELSPSM